MSFVYNWNVSNGDKVVVEYCFSSLDKCIKVVEMWVNGKFHRVNWMSPEGNKALMARLENDMTDRMCGTGEYSSEIDLDRDMPEFVGHS